MDGVPGAWEPGEVEALGRAERPSLLIRPRPESPPRRVALLSGSFDPMTIAHAELARASGRWADLVVLVYSVRTLPKEGEPEPALLDRDARLASLDQFVRHHPGTAVGLSSHGLLAHQVQAARSAFGDAELAVVIGSDKLLQLLDARWYEDRDSQLDALFREAGALFGMREGDERAVQAALSAPENRRWRDRLQRLPVPARVAAVSSREVRRRLREGRDVRDLVPREARGFLPRA